MIFLLFFFFFFQAEDGIRDLTVTGVQTCALPICLRRGASRQTEKSQSTASGACCFTMADSPAIAPGSSLSSESKNHRRSEEHTSELQSQSNLVCRLLLEKKKKNNNKIRHTSMYVT